MTLVADGPETSTIGRPSRALGASRHELGDRFHDPFGANDTDVLVGHEAERPATLTRTAGERECARVRARGRARR